MIGVARTLELRPGHTDRIRGATIELHLVKSIVLATPNALCVATPQRFAKCQKKRAAT